MKFFIPLTMTALLAVAAMPAFAEQAESQSTPARPALTSSEAVCPTPAMLFEQVDTDRNGFIDPKEWEKAFGPKDGKKAVSDKKRRSTFEIMDANDDGKISKQEFVNVCDDRIARRGKVFDRMDVNKDGMLSKEEFQQGTPFPARR